MSDSPKRPGEPPRYVSVLGLGFGDCGKGLFTDFLTRRLNAHTVVRFNGGAQAGHNVVLPDGRHHTFSQFGAGTFVPGAFTVLAAPVLVHPTALMVELDRLATLGVPDALQRLLIDRDCRLISPFHQAAGRLRELLRGSSPHGTCGVGVGETVHYSLRFPQETLRYGHLGNASLAATLLETIRHRLLSEFAPSPADDDPACRDEMAVLRSPDITGRWLDLMAGLRREVAGVSTDEIAARLHRPGTTVFEGAQGLLLDENRGFHPHTTWSSTHADALEGLASVWGLPEPIHHYGVLRAYLTRHGAGPFPTFDPALDTLPEPHNAGDGWQGRFRRGHPDAVLLRYALAHAGRLSGLLVSHLDVFAKGHGLQWCSAYDSGSGQIGSLAPGDDLGHQHRLTELLQRVSPIYDRDLLRSDGAFLERLASTTDIPVVHKSYGNTHRAVR